MVEVGAGAVFELRDVEQPAFQPTVGAQTLLRNGAFRLRRPTLLTGGGVKVRAGHGRILRGVRASFDAGGCPHPVALLPFSDTTDRVRRMAIPNTADVLAKWKTNTAGAAQRWAQNAEQTPVDPTAMAIQAIPYMQARFNDAVNSGRVANGLRRSGKTGWLNGIQSAVASGKFAAGVQGADAKFTAGFDQLLADESRGLSQLPTDKSTKAARRARLLAWADWMDGYTTRNP
jgi:hypothetical protein